MDTSTPIELSAKNIYTELYGAELPSPPDDSIVGTPDRVPGSVRRTMTIDMVWPGGIAADMELRGFSRDLLTPRTGEPVLLDSASMVATTNRERYVQSIATAPERPDIEKLIGVQGGSRLRGAIDEVLPGEREQATALHILLDDIAGTSLIGGFGWTRWKPNYYEEMRANAPAQAGQREFGRRKGRVICSGLRPEGWADSRFSAGADSMHCLRPAGDISTPHDPWGWHEWPEPEEVCMRRHRRIDVRREGDRIVVDAFFRDSVWLPDRTEMALHEYTVDSVVDGHTLELRDVTATPRVLPYPECQWAAPNSVALVGLPVATFRYTVQEALTEMKSCTHLNDMLRCLAEVPRLAAALA